MVTIVKLLDAVSHEVKHNIRPGFFAYKEKGKEIESCGKFYLHFSRSIFSIDTSDSIDFC